MALCAANPARAAGFYLQEQSVSGLGRCFAGSAAFADDASTIYYNPAGMTALSRAQGQVGVHLLHPSVDFGDDGSTATTTASGGTVPVANRGDGGNPYGMAEPVPNFYVVQPVPDAGIWMGVGVSAPFGLSNSYDDGWFGRYDSTSSDLKIVDIAPSLAFRLGKNWSLGAGLDIQHANADLRRAIPDPLAAGGPTPETDGELILKGESWAMGLNAGLQWEPRADLRIGLHYRSEVNHRLNGALKGVTPAGIGGGVGFRSPGSADLDLPQMATLAAAWDGSDRLTLLGHVIWFGWDSFQEIRMTLNSGAQLSDPQQYEDTVSAALGLEYRASDRWTLRTGFQYDETPTTGDNRTTRTPDGNRFWTGAGATYAPSSGPFSIDVALAYIHIDDGHIDRTASFDALYGMFGAGGASATVETRGTAESGVGIAGIALNYKF